MGAPGRTQGEGCRGGRGGRWGGRGGPAEETTGCDGRAQTPVRDTGGGLPVVEGVQTAPDMSEMRGPRAV